MAYGHLILAQPHFVNQQTNEFATLDNGEGLFAFAHFQEELVYAPRHRQRGRAIQCFRVQRFEYCLNLPLTPLKRLASGAQCVQIDQPFLVGIKESAALFLAAFTFSLQLSHAATREALFLLRQYSALKFGLNKIGRFKQRDHGFPDRFVKRLGHDHGIVADRALRKKPTHGTRTPIITPFVA